MMLFTVGFLIVFFAFIISFITSVQLSASVPNLSDNRNSKLIFNSDTCTIVSIESANRNSSVCQIMWISSQESFFDININNTTK